jgi:WD40 repeat protein
MRYILLGIILFSLLPGSVSTPPTTTSDIKHGLTQYSQPSIIKLDSPAKDIAWNPTASYLAIVGTDKLLIWSTASGKIAEDITSDFVSVADAVAWHPRGAKVATLGNRMIVWDIATGQDLNILSFPENETNSGTVAWSPQGDRLVFSHWNNDAGYIQTRILNENTGQFADIGHPSSSLINSLSWSPDGSMLAISDYDSAQVWDANTGRLVFELSKADYIVDLAWSPNGQMIAGANACFGSCETQKTFQIWDAHNGQLLYSTQAHSSDVLSITWSPDSTMLATGSADKTIKIWSVARRQLLTTYTGHQDSVTKVRWSPDSKKLASASDDNTVRIWDISDPLS